MVWPVTRGSPPCCGEPCPLRGSLLLAKRVGVRFRRVVRPPPQSGFRRSVEPRQRRGVAGAPPTRIDLLRDDESPPTLGFGASQLRAALPFRNRRPEPHSAAARPPLYLLRRLEILRDGGRHDDPELQAEPEQDEDAPVVARLPTVGDVSRHRKHDPYTDARRKRDEALLRHPHIPAAERKQAGPDGDPQPHRSSSAVPEVQSPRWSLPRLVAEINHLAVGIGGEAAASPPQHGCRLDRSFPLRVEMRETSESCAFGAPGVGSNAGAVSVVPRCLLRDSRRRSRARGLPTDRGAGVGRGRVELAPANTDQT